MRLSSRDERMALRRSQAARVQVDCAASDSHTRQLILAQATIEADGWAQWGEGGHVIIGDLQAGHCGDAPEVSEVSQGGWATTTGRPGTVNRWVNRHSWRR